MVNTTMTELREEGAPAPAHYSGWIGKVTGSALYRTTIGRLADSRHARLALLAGIPVIWLFVLHVGPILLGTALPAHILSPTVTSRGVVNMAALAAVQASHPSM